MWTWIKTHKVVTALIVLVAAILVVTWAKWPDSAKIESDARAQAQTEAQAKLKVVEDEKVKALKEAEATQKKLEASQKRVEEWYEWGAEQTNKFAVVSNELVRTKADLLAKQAASTADLAKVTAAKSTTNSVTITSWSDFLKAPIGTKFGFEGADEGRHTVVMAKDAFTGVRYGPDLPVTFVRGPVKGLFFPEIYPNGLRSILRGVDGHPKTPIPDDFRKKGFEWVQVTVPEDAGYFAPIVIAHKGEVWAIKDKDVAFIPGF